MSSIFPSFAPFADPPNAWCACGQQGQCARDAGRRLGRLGTTPGTDGPSDLFALVPQDRFCRKQPVSECNRSSGGKANKRARSKGDSRPLRDDWAAQPRTSSTVFSPDLCPPVVAHGPPLAVAVIDELLPFPWALGGDHGIVCRRPVSLLRVSVRSTRASPRTLFVAIAAATGNGRSALLRRALLLLARPFIALAAGVSGLHLRALPPPRGLLALGDPWPAASRGCTRPFATLSAIRTRFQITARAAC